MRRTVINLLAGLMALLLISGPVPGQAPQKPTKESPPPGTASGDLPTRLEDQLAQALRDNPDIRVAEAKVRSAEAELHRVRLQVMKDIFKFNADIEATQKTVEEAKQRFLKAKRLHERNAISREDYQAAQLTLERFQAELARQQAELPHLLGKSPRRTENDPHQAAPDDKIQDLLKKRLAAAREVRKAAHADYLAGKVSFERLHQASQTLLRARLELCRSNKERITILQEAVALAKELDNNAVARFQSGVAAQSEVLMARIARLEAEIDLQRAKGKMAP